MKTQHYRIRLSDVAIPILLGLLALGTGCSSNNGTSPYGNYGSGTDPFGAGGLGGGAGGGSALPPPSGYPTGGNLSLPTATAPTADQQYCLSQNSALSPAFGSAPSTYYPSPTYGYYGGSTSPYPPTSGYPSGYPAGYPPATSPTGCYNTGSVNYQPSQIYNAGLQSLQFMGQCYQQAAANAPPPGTDPQTVANAFMSAQQALISCYQNILSQQAQFAPWNTAQQQSYQTNDQALYLLLSTLSAQQH